MKLTSPKRGAAIAPGRLAVSGTATPGAFVRVDAGCGAPACSSLSVVDSRGRFTAEVTVRAARKAEISAQYDQRSEFAAAELTVKVRSPRTRAAAPADADDVEADAAELERLDAGSPAREQTSGRSTGSVFMIGDSLAVGTRTLLPTALPGWQVRTDARTGRPLAEGMAVLARASVPAGSVLAFSLFTNDGPGSVGALTSAVRTSAEAAGSGGCVVWATIVRPPVGGVTYEAANRALRSLDGATVAGATVRIADWAALVAQSGGLVAGDGVHGTAAGYSSRAELYADAIRSC